MKLAIAITTFNRPEILLRGLREQMKFLPVGPDVEARIFIVDDGSTQQVDERKLSEILVIPNSPFESVYFKQIENKGIAAAKNKCLELAEEWGADHIFLYDSDTWPKADDWWKPYVESKEPHLMYIFTKFTVDAPNGHNLSDCVEIYRDSDIVAFNHVRGCMLYLDRSVLDVVGGFDERYGKAMFEHTDFSNRIHNNGLTSFRVMDVPDSHDLIYSMDENREAPSSITRLERQQGLRNNRAMWQASLTSKEYCEFKPAKITGRDIVISGYFTNGPDFQRGGKAWTPDPDVIKLLEDSLKKHDVEFVLLHDSLDRPNKVDCQMDPYWNRFFRAYEYLRDHEDVGRVFIVDATDVTMLNNPFAAGQMQAGMIYAGDEAEKLGCRWIREKVSSEPFWSFVIGNRMLPLLNCGIIGGSREDVMMLIHEMLTLYADAKMRGNDMVLFNYVMRTRHAGQLVHGTGHINNLFKSYRPTDIGNEWFTHK